MRNLLDYYGHKYSIMSSNNEIEFVGAGDPKFVVDHEGCVIVLSHKGVVNFYLDRQKGLVVDVKSGNVVGKLVFRGEQITDGKLLFEKLGRLGYEKKFDNKYWVHCNEFTYTYV